MRTVSLLALACMICGCAGIRAGGTFSGPSESSAEVGYPQLADYLEQRTGGLIRRHAADSSFMAMHVRFSWDPFDKKRLLTPLSVEPDSIQNLFVLDEARFAAGSPDFLSAAYSAYRALPFDPGKQGHVRPYRCPAAWGSLIYPPLRSLARPNGFYVREFTPRDTSGISGSAYFDPEFQKGLDRETGTELTGGNTLRALFNGAESFPEKIRLASEARRFLYVAVMTIVADETGRDLIRVLVDRKRAGVDVRLIIDDFYTFSVSNFAVGVLEEAGIPVARVADKRLNQADRMFHDKFWIRDGEEAIIGGMNVLDYENESNGFNFMNRDTDLLVKGPAVTGLLERYVQLWTRYDKSGISVTAADSVCRSNREAEHRAGLRGEEHYAEWLRDPARRMQGICRTAVQGDGAEPQRIATHLIRYLEASRSSCFITSPEVEVDLGGPADSPIAVLSRTLIGKLTVPGYRGAYITNGTDGALGESTAFLRGRVKDAQLMGAPLWEEIITPLIDQSGRDVSRRVRFELAPLVDAGLRGYQYMNYMHAKEFYFDRLLVGIGSWNFDSYSAENNHECMIFSLDESLCRQIERRLVMDMVNAVPVIPSQELRLVEP
jgi:phosphatidylserine/phosphatidylglycerophosphate/cardiolipin synthase-like enzyme